MGPWDHQKRLDIRQGELTCGATWHAAGLVTRFHGGNNFRLWHDEAWGLIPSVAKHEQWHGLEIESPELVQRKDCRKPPNLIGKNTGFQMVPPKNPVINCSTFVLSGGNTCETADARVWTFSPSGSQKAREERDEIWGCLCLVAYTYNCKFVIGTCLKIGPPALSCFPFLDGWVMYIYIQYI